MKLRGSVLCTQCKDENVRKQNSQWDRSVQPCWTNEAKIKTKNKQQTKGQNKRRDRHANPLADLRIGSTHEATPPGRGQPPPNNQHRVPHASCTAKGLDPSMPCVATVVLDCLALAPFFVALRVSHAWDDKQIWPGDLHFVCTMAFVF